jgi:hypothetical protein
MTDCVSSFIMSRFEAPKPTHWRWPFRQRPQTGRTPSHLTLRPRLQAKQISTGTSIKSRTLRLEADDDVPCCARIARSASGPHSWRRRTGLSRDKVVLSRFRIGCGGGLGKETAPRRRRWRNAACTQTELSDAEGGGVDGDTTVVWMLLHWRRCAGGGPLRTSGVGGVCRRLRRRLGVGPSA